MYLGKCTGWLVVACLSSTVFCSHRELDPTVPVAVKLARTEESESPVAAKKSCPSKNLFAFTATIATKGITTTPTATPVQPPKEAEKPALVRVYWPLLLQDRVLLRNYCAYRITAYQDETLKRKFSFSEFSDILRVFSEDAPFIKAILESKIVNPKTVSKESGMSYLDILLACRKDGHINLQTLEVFLQAGVSPYQQKSGQSFIERVLNPLVAVKNKWEVEATIIKYTGSHIIDVHFKN